MRIPRSMTAFVMAAAPAGCKVGPNFKPPQPPVPEVYAGVRNPDVTLGRDGAGRVSPGRVSPGRDGAGQDGRAPVPATDASPVSFWWEQFHDPVLNRLEHDTETGNLDLKAAFLRIVEAREQAQSARAQRLPSLNASASYTREKLGLAGILKSQHINEGAAGSSSAGLISSLETPVNLYQLGFDASWELDLFGKVRRSVEVADAQSTGAASSETNRSLRDSAAPCACRGPWQPKRL